MPISIQKRLDFQIGQTESGDTHDVPIDQTFPDRAANDLAAIESFNKHLYRPNSYLHKWWARRSGTTFRYILKQLVDSPAKRDFYEPGGLEGKIILDPMMGGGTTLHEAIRMGANVIGIDIDPIPVLQTKASLTITSLSHKKAIFNQFLESLRKKLDSLYRTTCSICGKESEIQFVLYGLRRKCSCREVIFVDNLLLRQDHQYSVNICPVCHEVYTNQTHICQGEVDRPLKVKGTQHCEKCQSVFSDIIDQTFLERYVPLVIVGFCPTHNMFFKTITDNDLAILDQARLLSQETNSWDLQSFYISKGPKSDDLLRRSVTTYKELFTMRQLLYLNASIKSLSELSHNDRLWLALLISTSLEFNSLLCGYKGNDIRRPGAIRHVFSHHAYSFPYTALENNPIFRGNTSGTLCRLFNDRILRAGQWAVSPVEICIINGGRIKVPIHGEIDSGKPVTDMKSLYEGTRRFFVFQGDSANIDIPEGIVDYVVTDPPYYDNVQYSDLSNFFKVWLKMLFPHDANWSYNSLSSAVSEGTISGSRKYGEVLGKIWKMCYKALKKDRGRLIFTFHHWNHEAWAELTISLKKARFVLVNRYVVFSENPISVHIRSLKSLKHDTILVLKPDVCNGQLQKWPRPSQIDTTDSHAFCFDCGTALGWFLVADIDDEYIRREWKRLLGGDNNGKASS